MRTHAKPQLLNMRMAFWLRRTAVARSRKRAEKGLCTEAESDRFVTAARAAMDTYLKSQTDGGRLYGFESKWIRKDIGL